jgi:hypothetical protein
MSYGIKKGINIKQERIRSTVRIGEGVLDCWRFIKSSMLCGASIGKLLWWILVPDIGGCENGMFRQHGISIYYTTKSFS